MNPYVGTRTVTIRSLEITPHGVSSKLVDQLPVPWAIHPFTDDTKREFAGTPWGYVIHKGKRYLLQEVDGKLVRYVHAVDWEVVGPGGDQAYTDELMASVEQIFLL